MSEKGSLLFIDSSSCLHSGSRIKKGHRLYLMIQYAPISLCKRDRTWPGKISNKIFYKNQKYFEKYLFKLPPHLLLKIKIFKLNFLFQV